MLLNSLGIVQTVNVGVMQGKEKGYWKRERLLELHFKQTKDVTGKLSFC